jgi:hypothetical protein
MKMHNRIAEAHQALNLNLRTPDIPKNRTAPLQKLTRAVQKLRNVTSPPSPRFPIGQRHHHGLDPKTTPLSLQNEATSGS